MPLAMSPFKVDASTASVMLPISRRSLLYLRVPSAASTQMMREFHFPPEQLHAVFQRTADVLFQLSLIHSITPRFRPFYIIAGYLCWRKSLCKL